MESGEALQENPYGCLDNKVIETLRDNCRLAFARCSFGQRMDGIRSAASGSRRANSRSRQMLSAVWL